MEDPAMTDTMTTQSGRLTFREIGCLRRVAAWEKIGFPNCYLTKTLEKLEGKGFVRSEDQKHGRAYYLTDAGRIVITATKEKTHD